MPGLRKYKIFFVSLILSVILHVSFLFGLSGFVDYRFLNPSVFKVILVNLKEEKSLNEALRKSTDYNLLKIFSGKLDTRDDSNQNINQRDDKKRIEEGIEKAGTEDAQTISDASRTQGEFLHNREEIPIQEITTKAPVQGEVDKIAYMKSGEPFYKKEPLKIMKTAREIFYYDISWLGIHVGKAILEATHTNGVIRITSQVHSAPFISTFYRVEDFAESVIIDGIPVNFRIKQREGKYRSDKETIFDVNNNVITFFNYLNGTRDEHSMKDENIWDVISGFFYLRTQPLEVGKPVYINIFDSNTFYRAKIDVLAKEKIKVANGGEIDTFIVKPTLQSEGLFQRKGDILIWISDDEKRIPIRVATSVSVGHVVAELQNITTVKGKE
jgi:hypothetical protein